jgi:hypothetical protein
MSSQKSRKAYKQASALLNTEARGVKKYNWSMLVEVGDVVKDVATMIPFAEFVKFEDSYTGETYAIFKVNGKVLKVPCDEIFDCDIDYDEKVRILRERVIEYIKDGLFC